MDFSSLILKATDFIEISRDGWIPVIEMKCQETKGNRRRALDSIEQVHNKVV